MYVYSLPPCTILSAPLVHAISNKSNEICRVLLCFSTWCASVLNVSSNYPDKSVPLSLARVMLRLRRQREPTGIVKDPRR